MVDLIQFDCLYNNFHKNEHIVKDNIVFQSKC